MSPKTLRILAFSFFMMGLFTMVAFFMYKPERSMDLNPPLPVLGKAPAFALTDTTGATFDSQSLEGKIWVADFFFSSCGGPCPTMAKNMGRLQAQFSGDALTLVNFSVDPETDTPETLALYAKKIKADTSRWHLLTGPEDAIRNLLGADGFLVGSKESLMNHAVKFILVDGKGNLRGFYDGTNDEEMAELTVDIARLLKEQA